MTINSTFYGARLIEANPELRHYYVVQLRRQGVSGYDGWMTGPAYLEPAVSDLVLTFDEGWTPHVQATITIPIGNIAEVDRAVLDPRGRGIHITIAYGYASMAGSGGQDNDYVELRLASVRYDRPEGTLTLVAVSQEMALVEAVSVTEDRSFVAGDWTSGVVQNLIGWAGAGSLLDTTAGAANKAIGAALTIEKGRPFWPYLVDLVDRLGLWLYSDGIGNRFVLATRPTGDNTPTTSHTIRSGALGTLLDASYEMSREDWATTVIVRHRWRTAAGVEGSAYGWARSTIPVQYHKTLVIDRDVPATDTGASGSAAAILSRMETRGKTWSGEALAAYWLRPGHRVTVERWDGWTESCMVARVTYRPLRGTMQLTTRAPGTAL